MKKINNLIFLLTLTTAFSFCKVQQFTPVDFPKGQIIFGSGGGITGAVNETYLLENGEMFSKSGLDTNYVALKRLKNQVVEQIFYNVEVLKLREIQVNKPGNMYNFIRLKDKHMDHQIVWSGQDAVSIEVIKFYKILNHLAQIKDGQ